MTEADRANRAVASHSRDRGGGLVAGWSAARGLRTAAAYEAAVDHRRRGSYASVTKDCSCQSGWVGAARTDWEVDYRWLGVDPVDKRPWQSVTLEW